MYIIYIYIHMDMGTYMYKYIYAELMESPISFRQRARPAEYKTNI